MFVEHDQFDARDDFTKVIEHQDAHGFHERSNQCESAEVSVDSPAG